MTYTDRYNIVYDFHRKHMPKKPITDEYYQRVYADFMELMEKYKNDSFLTALLTAVYVELARVAKEE